MRNQQNPHLQQTEGFTHHHALSSTMCSAHTHTHHAWHKPCYSNLGSPAKNKRFDAKSTHFGTTQKVFRPSDVCVFCGSEHKQVYMTNMPLVIAYSFKGTVLHRTGNTLLYFFKDMTLDFLKAVKFFLSVILHCCHKRQDHCIIPRLWPKCFTI